MKTTSIFLKRVTLSTLFLSIIGFYASAKPLSIYYGNYERLPFELDSQPEVTGTFRRAVFNSLLELGEDAKVYPSTLSRAHFDYKKKGYILELREGLKFHNGRLATIKDLEFTLLRGFFSKRKNFWRVYIGNIAGTEKIKPGTTYQPGAVSGIKVVSERELLVQLSAPNPSFLHSLSNDMLGLVPIEELEGDYFSWKSLPIGTGRFKVTSVDQKSKTIQLVDWNSKQNWSLHFGPTLNPDSEIIYTSMPQFKKTVFPQPLAVTGIFFNMTHPDGRSSDFRKAIASKVDRASIEKELKSLAANQLLPPKFWGRMKNLKPIKSDYRLAPRKSVKVLVLSTKDSNSEILSVAKKQMQEALERLGSEVEFQSTENKFFTEAEMKSSPIIIYSLNSRYYDPLIMFNSFAPGSPFDDARIENDKKFDELYSIAKSTESFETRLKSIQDLSAHLVENAYVIPIGYKFSQFYLRPNCEIVDSNLNHGSVIKLEEVKCKTQ